MRRSTQGRLLEELFPPCLSVDMQTQAKTRGPKLTYLIFKVYT